MPRKIKPLLKSNIPEGKEHYFWSRVDVRKSTDCWNWKLKKNPQGYGLAFLGKEIGVIRAHKAALVLSGQDCLGGDKYNALHSCDNPGCCNPGHLRYGSSAENTRDCIRRDRRSDHKKHGELCHLSKITKEEASKVRQLLSEGYGVKEICEQLKIPYNAAYDIKRGKSWKWLGDLTGDIKRTRRPSEAEVTDAFHRLRRGERVRDVCKSTGLPQSTVSRIKSGVRWGNLTSALENQEPA